MRRLRHLVGTALWGMGAVQSDQGKSEEAVKLFAEAEPLVGNQLNFSIDYARVLAQAGIDLHRDPLLADALPTLRPGLCQGPGQHPESPELGQNALQDWPLRRRLGEDEAGRSNPGQSTD